MNTTLTQRIVLLNRVEDRTDDRCATFGRRSDPGVLIQIDAAHFAEMGSPDQVTVTIEPGDRLN